MVNLVTVPHIYTILAYGLSICLWALIPQIVLLDGVPLYLIHPYFTAELFLMLSTLIAWTIFLAISLIHSLEQDVSITKAISQNLFTALLVLITIIAAISGCIYFFTEVVYYPEPPNGGRWVTIIPPQNPLGPIYGFGILFSEAGWIILGIAKILKKKLEWARGDLNA